MIPKPYKPPEDHVDSWLMSYADMITLLLCFFIIFVSVSEPKKDKITEIADGMSGKFGAVLHSTPFKDAVQQLRAIVEKQELYRDVAIDNTGSGMAMELASARFFKEASGEFDASTKPILDQLLAVLQQADLTGYSILVEAYTADTPTAGGLYPTNWELSAMRAAKIASIMVSNGFEPAKIRATGFGDAHPKVPNRDKDGNPIPRNQETNQRVVVRLLRVE